MVLGNPLASHCLGFCIQTKDKTRLSWGLQSVNSTGADKALTCRAASCSALTAPLTHTLFLPIRTAQLLPLGLRREQHLLGEDAPATRLTPPAGITCRALPTLVGFLFLISVLVSLKSKLHESRGLAWLTDSPPQTQGHTVPGTWQTLNNSFKPNNFQDDYCQFPGKLQTEELGRTHHSFDCMTEQRGEDS